MPTMTYSQELTTCACWCGINLAIPSNLYRVRHEEGGDVFCPLGHRFTWGEGEADKLRKRLERAEARATHAEDQRRAEERAHSATKGQLTKARNRAAAAVCPVEGCKRQFVNMARHLQTKHPEFLHDHA